MIDVIRQQFKEGMPLNDKMNLTREFLQILCLKIMDERKMFEHVAFLGGTSLRILFDLRRFSEDLDFSVIKKEGYDFTAFSEKMTADFERYGFPAETKPKMNNTVQSSLIKFPGLLKELGLAPLPSQKITIKLEVDTNPPQGWKTEQMYLDKNFFFSVTHYDLPSLFAGKLHACLFRSFVKGRDFYDLAWYLMKKIHPNYALLNNAIYQTQSKKLDVNEGNLKSLLSARIKEVDFSLVCKDVERFLERREELDFLNAKAMEKMVESFS